jgi:indolepyruvate ferredoxin oxidoreductase alpha subunit
LKNRTEVMIGNFAIARGLVEAGVELAAAYPGTPSSEILPGIIEFKKREGLRIHTEWSTNERCAMEVAMGAARSGKRAACMMKQVGLNVAFPSLLHSLERPLTGGLLIVSCDDPGPQSSQTEQDTRLLATLFRIPLFDPASPASAGDLAYYGLEYSFTHHTPVILRPTHRVSHAREAVKIFVPGTRKVVLDEGIQVEGKGKELGVVASGMSYSVVLDVIRESGLEGEISLYKVTRIFPLAPDLQKFVAGLKKVLVIEETEDVVEALLGDTEKVLGRRTGHFPREGELSYDVIRGVLQGVAESAGILKRRFIADRSVEESLEGVKFPTRPPRLCAGCPHRASFYAMRYTFPDAIFPGDIGCYTLGTSMGAVDTFVDMGSGVTMASGFYNTLEQDGVFSPILASVGDSTFFHACLAPVYDAAKTGKRFILVIMDNATTAMTGMQPTPQSGVTADGSAAKIIPIESVVKGLGVKFLQIVDPYDMPGTMAEISKAYEYLKKGGPGPAVIIARRECLLRGKEKSKAMLDVIPLEKDCIGCKSCLTLFGCPAISFDEDKHRVAIDRGLCTRCGMCLFACTMALQGKGLFGFQESYFLRNRL